jgi:two-component system LytT family sensor kinase
MNRIDWRQVRSELLLGLAFWGIVSLLFYLESWVNYVTAVRPNPYAWAEVWWPALIEDGVNCLVWTLFTPGVLALARRFPIRQGTVLPNAGIHLLAALALGSISVIINFWVATYTFADGPHWPRFYYITIYNRVLGYAAVAAGGHAMEVYRRYRDRELHASQLETQLARAHLHALEMQVQPHFLFNTLNSISELVHHDPDAADLMITQLGDLFRMTTDGTARAEVSLARELSFVCTYLDIERTRFQDRLSVRQQVDQDVLECMVPNLILQPLVENAVRHGLSPRVAPGTVTITARRVNDRLRLTVRDDGRGLPPPEARRERVGLGNTRTRLRQTYGDDHRFELVDAPGGGTLVMIDIPYRLSDAEPAGAPGPVPLSLTR